MGIWEFGNFRLVDHETI